jgi:hypothetical protein
MTNLKEQLHTDLTAAIKAKAPAKKPRAKKTAA